MDTTIKELIKLAGSTVHSVNPEDSLIDTLKIMAKYRIGAVLVTDGNNTPVGIFSERDYARLTAEREHLPGDTPIRELMTNDVVTISPDQTVQECMEFVTRRKIRHLPVMDGAKLVGIVSIGDLVKAAISEMEALINEKQNLIEKLEGYISGSIT